MPRVCSEGGSCGRYVRYYRVAVPTFIIPPSLPFPAIRRCRPCVVVPTIRSSSPRCSFVTLARSYVLPAVRCPHPFVVHCRCPRSIVVSATITPYEQWLAGGVAALCDMAFVWRCSQETGPVAALRADAHSGGIGPGNGDGGGVLGGHATSLLTGKNLKRKRKVSS